MEQRPSDTQRSLDPSAKEFHPTPAHQKNHTFIRSTPPPPPPIVVFHPTSPQLPTQSQIFLSYNMSPFYFHLPVAPLQPLMYSVPPQHVTEQGTLIRPGNNIYPARQPTSDGGADSMCSSSLENDLVLVKKCSKGLDWRFVIGGDSRTTLMIKNIPNKYSLKLLLSTLDNHCAHCNDQIIRGEGEQAARFSSYDFVYLPMDFNNKCNVGYGFVNMTSTDATVRLYKAFHGQSWEVFNSHKICQVTYARLQGLETLKDHFRNSRFPIGRDEEVLPVLFDPPRDGRQQLTPPQPICVVVDSTDNGSYQRQSV